MKPKKVEKKLFLNKKTVADLNNQQMIGLRGGKTSEDSVEVCCITQTCTCYSDCGTCESKCLPICFCTAEITTCVQ